MVLDRDSILAADDLKRETVEVPEWGGEVIVREMTGRERDRFEAGWINADKGDVQVNPKNLDNFRARLVAQTVVDEEGNRLFTDDDAVELGSKSAAALDRVFTVATRLSGITDKDVDDLVKN